MTAPEPTLDTVTLERDGHVLAIGLNRPDKRNAFNTAMLADLSRAYGLLEKDENLRAGGLFAHGDHFTSGLDLVDVGPAIAAGQLPFPDEGRDPWRLDGTWTKPIVAAANGWCLTLGIELLLAAVIRVAAAGTRFSQMEVLRGIYPFGGATIRLPRHTGWGNAMRWLLTGDEFDAEEALRIGLIQEIATDAATAAAKAREIAHTIADRAAPARRCGGVGVGAAGRFGRRSCRHRTVEARGDAAVRHRRRRRGCAVVRRASRSPIPGPLVPATLGLSLSGRASHGPLQEQRARSRVQPFRGARAGEGAGDR
jgi:enoyl-CoA hydratase/carnithine racemase